MLIIDKKMKELRQNLPKKIDGVPVKYCYDYLNESITNMISNKKYPTGLPQSNVLIFETDKGTRVAARPSGTEPKIKYYISVNQDGYHSKTMEELQSKIVRIIEELKLKE